MRIRKFIFFFILLFLLSINIKAYWYYRGSIYSGTSWIWGYEQVEENIRYYFYHDRVGSHGYHYFLYRSTPTGTVLVKSEWGTQGSVVVGSTHFFDPFNGCIIELWSGSQIIYNTTDGGLTWNSVHSCFDATLTMADTNLFYFTKRSAFLNKYEIYRNDTQVYITSKYVFASYLTSIEFTNDSTGLITCQDTLANNVILKTSDYGSNWTEVFMDTGNWFTDIQFMSDSTAYVIGMNGIVLKSDDAGNSWVPVSLNTNRNLRSIDFSGNGNGYIVGDSGTVFKTIDYGNTWATDSFITNERLIYVRVFDNGHAYTNSLNGKFYSTQNLIDINEINKRSLNVFPNPANDYFQIIFPENIKEYKVTLFDIQGRKILTSLSSRVDISKIDSGIYFVISEIDNKIYQNKIEIEH